ncbi:MAG: hypothetical protein PF541_05985 [Prolixibacteraceae bacterium]|jgi:hypothetical protein|nr:hypothetical protein [Prolixibacteraceae bacterium]
MNLKQRNLLGIPIIVLFLLLLVFFGTEKILQNWLNHHLPEVLNQNPDRKYEIVFESTSLNFLKQNLYIRAIEINEVADTTKGNTITIDYFKIEKPGIKKLFFEHVLGTDKLIVNEPTFEIFSESNEVHDKEEKLNEIWKDVFTRIQINDLEIRNASLNLYDEKSFEPSVSISNLNIFVQSFNVDTLTIKNPLPLTFRSLIASCFEIKVKIDSIATLQIYNIELQNDNIQFNRINLIPTLTKSDFIVLNRKKDDWVNMYINSVSLNHFDWSFDSTGSPKFIASSLHIDSIKIHALVDDHFNKMNQNNKPLLSELFRNLPVSFKLDSFRVLNSSVFFEARPKNQDSIAGMSFYNLFASGYNLHNIKNTNLFTEFDILSNFMNGAIIEASLRMDVNDIMNRFQFNGQLNNLSTESVNRILQPMAGIETVGQLYGINFNILADNNHSTGTVNFEYDDLKIKVLHKNSKEKNILISIISNLALRKSNVSSDKRFKQGKVDYVRDKSKSIFGFIWQSIKVGLIDTISPFDLSKDKRNKASYRRNK